MIAGCRGRDSRFRIQDSGGLIRALIEKFYGLGLCV